MIVWHCHRHCLAVKHMWCLKYTQSVYIHQYYIICYWRHITVNSKVQSWQRDICYWMLRCLNLSLQPTWHTSETVIHVSTTTKYSWSVLTTLYTDIINKWITIGDKQLSHISVRSWQHLHLPVMPGFIRVKLLQCERGDGVDDDNFDPYVAINVKECVSAPGKYSYRISHCCHWISYLVEVTANFWYQNMRLF